MQEYIHYGNKKFKEELFRPIKNIENFVKPNGGLWASRITKERPYGDWREWVDAEHFSNEFGEKYGRDNFFKFQLKKDANILTIKRAEELLALPKIGAIFPLPFVVLDFEKLAKEYDGIEVLMSEEDKLDLEIGKGLYWELYGWDCDSLLVFNKDIVEVLE